MPIINPSFTGIVGKIGINYYVTNNVAPSPSKWNDTSIPETGEERGFATFLFTKKNSKYFLEISGTCYGFTGDTQLTLKVEGISSYEPLDSTDFSVSSYGYVTQTISTGTFSTSIDVTSIVQSNNLYIRLSVVEAIPSSTGERTISISSISLKEATIELGQISINANSSVSASGLFTIYRISTEFSATVLSYSISSGVKAVTRALNYINIYPKASISASIVSAGILIDGPLQTVVSSDYAEIQHGLTNLLISPRATVSAKTSFDIKNLNVLSTASSSVGRFIYQIGSISVSCRGLVIADFNLTIRSISIISTVSINANISLVLVANNISIVPLANFSVNEIIKEINLFNCSINPILSITCDINPIVKIFNINIYPIPIINCIIVIGRTEPLGPFMLESSRLTDSDYVNIFDDELSDLENDCAGLLGIKLETEYSDYVVAPRELGVPGGAGHRHKGIGPGGDGTERISHDDLLNAGLKKHSEIDDHINSANPHTGHEIKANKGIPGGYCELSLSGLIPTTRIPDGIIIDRCSYVFGAQINSIQLIQTDQPFCFNGSLGVSYIINYNNNALNHGFFISTFSGKYAVARNAVSNLLIISDISLNITAPNYYTKDFLNVIIRFGEGAFVSSIAYKNSYGGYSLNLSSVLTPTGRAGISGPVPPLTVSVLASEQINSGDYFYASYGFKAYLL